MRVTALHVYPIKSCGAVSLRSAAVTARGLERDRRWMLVDVHGAHVTQRTVPALTQFSAAAFEDGFEIRHRVSTVQLPWAVTEGPRRTVTVWRDRCEAVVHPVGSAWFSTHLEQAVELVFMPESTERAVPGEQAQPGDVVSFADGFPVLLASEASLGDLNQRLPQPVSMARFRPNVTISADVAWAEDAFDAPMIGTTPFRNATPCERCVVTTLDPETGHAGREPLRTLATFRERDGAVVFGVNLVPDGTGTVAVGDGVQGRVAG